MRTTLEIERDLLEEAVRVTGAATKSVAVRLGLKALLDEAARRRLAVLRESARGRGRFTAAASDPE
jgi:Arc/MetJ family transcription regulator